jgi:hypothetical protein
MDYEWFKNPTAKRRVKIMLMALIISLNGKEYKNVTDRYDWPKGGTMFTTNKGAVGHL